MGSTDGLRQTWYGRAVLVVLLAVFGLHNAATITEGPELVLLCVAIPLCAGVLLARRIPWFVAPVVVSVAAAAWGGLLFLLLCVALFDLAVDRHVRVALGCVAAVAGVRALVDLATATWQIDQYSSLALLSLLSIVSGLWRGSRRRMVQLLADQVKHLQIEGTLREEAARSKERSRIAAEMHDILAHRLSLIALHTGVLVASGDALSPRVTDRLRLLRAASTEALTDLRDVLGALHQPKMSSHLTPVPGQVQQVVDEARAAGQDVEVTVDGSPDLVPTTHRLAVYRVVQEALTNARKHAAGAAVTVHIDYRTPATRVEVTNAAATSAAGAVASGYGLIGLRERITGLGGDLRSGPGGAGSWRLTAHLPHPTGTTQNRPTP
ncbi:sensor histidine kinase [Micromonospora sp. NPDC020750]|uniref:sensor histidine kinase n=1 Tax=unclassified Micromonospora TaxID=2617518 RepID=UPI0037ABEB1A